MKNIQPEGSHVNPIHASAVEKDLNGSAGASPAGVPAPEERRADPLALNLAKEIARRIQRTAHKHETQYWLDAPGTDAEKLAKIWADTLDLVEALDLIPAAPTTYVRVSEALRDTLTNLRVLRDALPLKDTAESHRMILSVGAEARAALSQSTPNAPEVSK